MKLHLNEDTIKQDNKWVNKGKEGTHATVSKSEGDKNIIIDVVKGIFETGHEYIEDKQEMEEIVNHRLTSSSYSRLYAFYQELLDLGPEGFYEEYKDKLEFDPDFIEEYIQEDPYEHLENWLSKNPIHNLKLDSFEKFREYLAKNVFNKKVEKLSEDEDYAIQEIWEDSSLYEGKENLKESLLKIGVFS